MANDDAPLSVDELQQEWYEMHGWATQPPADVIAYWRQVADAAHAIETRDAHEVARPETVVGAELPAAVVIPAHPHADRSAGFDVELSYVDGLEVLIVYSTVAELVAQMGPEQPWVAVPMSVVEEIYSGLPIVLDPTPGIAAGPWTRSRLRALQEVLSDG